MINTFLWVAGLTACIAIITLATERFNTEQIKQNAFMMKACVDAGGNWERSGWTAYYECKRPNN